LNCKNKNNYFIWKLTQNLSAYYENGELEEMLPSSESPASEKVLNWIN
jgi:hypothetical protein